MAHQRPAAAAAGLAPGPAADPLTLALVQGGSLRGHPEAGRRSLALVAASGQAVLRYAGLLAFDTAEWELAASLAVDGDRLLALSRLLP